MDKTGQNQLSVHDHIFLQRLDRDGNIIVNAREKEGPTILPSPIFLFEFLIRQEIIS